ncbi:MAG: hypothetical protein WDA00_04395 [Eubacteriales bacterium]
MKRLLSCLLLLAAGLSLAGCERNYQEAKSTPQEKQVVARLGDYEIRYDLFRALFYAMKDELDGGDGQAWEGASGEALWQTALDQIEGALADLYAVFDLCREIGVDPFGREIDKTVQAYVRADIEGGVINGEPVGGYGSQQAYLDALAARHMTDHVSRLFYRYSACLSVLYDHYVQTYAGGSIPVSDEITRTFFESEEVVHVGWVHISPDNGLSVAENRAHAEDARAALLLCEGYEEMKNIIALYSLSMASADIEAGFYLTPYAYDRPFRPVVEAAYSLPVGGISPVIETADGWFVLVRLDKDPAAPDSPALMNRLTTLYLEHRLYSRLFEMTAGLLPGITYTDAFDRYNAGNLT